MFVSKEYATESGPFTRLAARKHGRLRRGQRLSLPIQVDDIELEGLLPTVGYIPMNTGIERIGDMLVKKLQSTAAAQ